MGKQAVGKYAALTVLVVVTAFACLGLAPTAQADTGPGFDLAVDRHAVRSGEPFTATGTATTRCQWILDWNGDRRVANARTIVASYTAPQVTRPTRIPLHGTCFYDPSRTTLGTDRVDAAPTSRAAGAAAQRLTVTVPPSWRRTVVITVLPPATAVSPPASAGGPGHPGGTLPGTGGPALLTLLAALGAVLVGGVLVRRPRVLRVP